MKKLVALALLACTTPALAQQDTLRIEGEPGQVIIITVPETVIDTVPASPVPNPNPFVVSVEPLTLDSVLVKAEGFSVPGFEGSYAFIGTYITSRWDLAKVVDGTTFEFVQPRTFSSDSVKRYLSVRSIQQGVMSAGSERTDFWVKRGDLDPPVTPPDTVPPVPPDTVPPTPPDTVPPEPTDTIPPPPLTSAPQVEVTGLSVTATWEYEATEPVEFYVRRGLDAGGNYREAYVTEPVWSFEVEGPGEYFLCVEVRDLAGNWASGARCNGFTVNPDVPPEPENPVSLHVTTERYAEGLPDTLEAGVPYYVRVDSPEWDADSLGYDVGDAPGVSDVTFFIDGTQVNVENLYPYEMTPRTRTFAPGEVLIEALVKGDTTFTLSHLATVIGAVPPDSTPPVPPDTIPPVPPDTTPTPPDTSLAYSIYAEPNWDCWVYDQDTLQTGGYSLTWVAKDPEVRIDSVVATLNGVRFAHNRNCGDEPTRQYDGTMLYCPTNYGIQQNGSQGWQQLVYSVYGSDPETKTLDLYFHDSAGTRCGTNDGTVGYVELDAPQNIRLETRTGISHVGDIVNLRWDEIPQHDRYDDKVIGELVYYYASLWAGDGPWTPDAETIYAQSTWMGGTGRTISHRPPNGEWTPLPDTMTACVQAIAVDDETRGYEGTGGFVLRTFPTYGTDAYPEPSGWLTSGPWPVSETTCTVLTRG